MKRNTKPYSIFQLASAVVMIMALLWLTVSTPFVYASQQELIKQHKGATNSSALVGTEEEAANSLGNTTEEKKPSSGSSLTEEYLHDNHIVDRFISPISQFHKCENARVYNAFHGEVQVPPPNRA